MTDHPQASGAGADVQVLLVPVGDMIAKLNDDGAWQTYMRAHQAVSALVRQRDEMTELIRAQKDERVASAVEIKALREALIAYRDAIRYSQDKRALMAAIKAADELSASALSIASAAKTDG